MTIMGCIALLSTVLYYMGIIALPEGPYIPISAVFLILIFTPVMIYFASRKNFYSNARLREYIQYEISNDKVKVTGESFKSEFDWKSTYKLVELSKWFLIYQSRQMANLIPKSSLSATEIKELREIFQNQKMVKQKLRA